MWNWIKGIGEWALGILRLHGRVKAIEERLADEDRVSAEVIAEQKRQAEELCKNIHLVDGAVYLREPMPGRDTGPYCPTCWRPPNPDTLARLHTEGYSWQEFDEERLAEFPKRKWVCGACRTQLDLWDH